MQIRKRVHGSRAWGRQRWGGERRGDIWGAEAICGDIFPPLLIFNTSSRAHLSPALLTSSVLLGAAASAAPNTRVIVCFAFVVRYARPDRKWWKINPRRRMVRGIKSLRVVSSEVTPLRVPVSLNLWSSPLVSPHATRLTMSSVPSRWSFVVKAAASRLRRRRRRRNIKQCCCSVVNLCHVSCCSR